MHRNKNFDVLDRKTSPAERKFVANESGADEGQTGKRSRNEFNTCHLKRSICHIDDRVMKIIGDISQGLRSTLDNLHPKIGAYVRHSAFNEPLPPDFINPLVELAVGNCLQKRAHIYMETLKSLKEAQQWMSRVRKMISTNLQQRPAPSTETKVTETKEAESKESDSNESDMAAQTGGHFIASDTKRAICYIEERVLKVIGDLNRGIRAASYKLSENAGSCVRHLVFNEPLDPKITQPQVLPATNCNENRVRIYMESLKGLKVVHESMSQARKTFARNLQRRTDTKGSEAEDEDIEIEE